MESERQHVGNLRPPTVADRDVGFKRMAGCPIRGSGMVPSHCTWFRIRQVM